MLFAGSTLQMKAQTLLGFTIAKSKDKTQVFKRPKTPLTVALVLDAEEWETYLECADTNTDSMLNQMSAGYSQQRMIASSARSVAGRTARLSVSDWDGTSKRPSTPPPSKKRSLLEYISPDRSRLWKALAIGGASDISKANNMHTSERIEFYQLKQIPLHELLGSEQAQGAQFFTCDPSLAFQGSMVVEFASAIGTGTFKTAHRGHLSLIHLPLVGLGTSQNELVAVKRMYRKQANNASGNWVKPKMVDEGEYRMPDSGRMTSLYCCGHMRIIEFHTSATSKDMEAIVTDRYSSPAIVEGKASMFNFVLLSKKPVSRGARPFFIPHNTAGEFDLQDLEWSIQTHRQEKAYKRCIFISLSRWSPDLKLDIDDEPEAELSDLSDDDTQPQSEPMEQDVSGGTGDTADDWSNEPAAPKISPSSITDVHRLTLNISQPKGGEAWLSFRFLFPFSA
ncbi:hypothetical protein B0H14DRAFT_2611904 [Mycena olivaceomarginata]|nr:hypothetical protein B0H14DRAFT_2611904 [Mycena olivaceomarginata]